MPPTERPLNNFSASSQLSALMEILDLFSFSFTRPKLAGTSLAIKRFLPIGKVISIILFASLSSMRYSGLDISLKRLIEVKFPPNTDL